jgi:hypothetical protein
MAQGEGPEFKPQYHKKTKKEEFYVLILLILIHLLDLIKNQIIKSYFLNVSLNFQNKFESTALILGV